MLFVCLFICLFCLFMYLKQIFIVQKYGGLHLFVAVFVIILFVCLFIYLFIYLFNKTIFKVQKSICNC